MTKNVSEERLFLRLGSGFVIGSSGEAILFTRKQAERRAAKLTPENECLVKKHGFTQRFGRADPQALGINKEPYWYAVLQKIV